MHTTQALQALACAHDTCTPWQWLTRTAAAALGRCRRLPAARPLRRPIGTLQGRRGRECGVPLRRGLAERGPAVLLHAHSRPCRRLGPQLVGRAVRLLR